MLLDIDYILLGIPGLALSLWAQARIFLARRAASRLPVSSGLTGAEAADELLLAEGVTGVTIVPASGELADHYDRRRKVLRLSERAFSGRSLAAVGVAAHEAGHAIQDASGYRGLLLRDAVVPVAGVVSTTFWIMILAGVFLEMFGLVLTALYLLEFGIVLQLINLPVEFDAGRRARRVLLSTGMITPEEDPPISRVLNAAAWTHVAAALTNSIALLVNLLQSGLRRCGMNVG